MARRPGHYRTKFVVDEVSVPYDEALRAEGRCPTCRKPIKLKSFKTPWALREYRFSGLCRRCQRDAFGYAVDISWE